MSTTLDASPRFFRPNDVSGLRRNQTQIHLARFGRWMRAGAFLVILTAVVSWTWSHTQSDRRFAVKHVEITGAVHAPKAAIEAIARRYANANLFRIDIARVQREVGALGWVERAEVEKKLPDVLRIRLVERKPLALLESRGRFVYTDHSGVVLDPLTPAIGDDDLPLVKSAAGDELRRTVAFLDELKAHDAVLYSRISEISPVAPRGFAIFDRDLGARILINSDDAVGKWRDLYAIVAAESLGRSEFEYADLRFDGRIVVKPLHARITSSKPATSESPVRVTN